MHINDKILQARKLKGWSQQEIAEKLEESRSTYAEWERETIPRADILVKIAAVTGVSILDFIKALDEKVAGAPLSDEKPAILKEKPSADFLAGKLESKEETIQQIEARRKDAEENANIMREHYKDMKNALERAQITINEILKPIKEQTAEILSNSIQLKDNTMDAIIEMQSEHKAMMDTMDLAARLPVGTTVGNADILEGAAQEIRGKGHKKKHAHKMRKG